MGNYRIELLLKVNNSEHSIFNSEEKIIELFKLSDKFKIQNSEDGKSYNLTIRDEIFSFIISKESEYIYSIVVNATEKGPCYGIPELTLDALAEAVRELKVTISSNLNNCSYEVLWDDVGIYYSKMAYPKIVEIKNLMRKLITKFMLVSVGMDFFNNIPNDINIREDKNTDSGFLHNIDFIDLTKYLFAARPLRQQDELLNIIDTLDENVLPDSVNLLNYKKDSYWNRYFKDIVGNDINAESINKDWAQLYKLRCKVAHSKFLKKNEWETIYSICQKLSQAFNAALNALNDINLSEENKEIISEDIFTEIEGKVWYEKLYELITKNFDDEFTLNELYSFESLLKDQYPENNTIQASIRRNLQKLRDQGKIKFIANGKYKIIK